MNSFDRRKFLHVAGGASLLAGLPYAAGAAVPTTLDKVRLIQPTSSLSYMPIYVARYLKIFESEGLSVESTITGGDGPDIQALAAGGADFAVSPPTHLFTLHQQGRDLLGIAAMAGRLLSTMIIRKDVAAQRGLTASSTIEQRLKALRGLTIGATVPGSLTWNVAMHYIKQAGFVPQVDVKVIAAGSGSTSVAALEKKIVDLYVLPSPIAEQVIARGLGEYFINITAGDDPRLLEFLHAILYVRPDYAKANPDITRRMTRALLRASGWIVTHKPEEVADVIRPMFSSVEPAILNTSIANVSKAMVPDGRISPKALANVQDIEIENGTLRQRIPFDAIFTTAYLPT